MFKYILLLAVLSVAVSAQGFKNVESELKTFDFNDSEGRNQANFFSTTPLEDIEGTANGFSGEVTLNPADIKPTLKGELKVTVESMKTGIKLRDEHLVSPQWLDAEKFPEISFKSTSVESVSVISENKVECTVKGMFTLHGKSTELTTVVTLIYMKESEKTKERGGGDLLAIMGSFNVKLSDYGVSNDIVGNKVAEEIEIKLNAIGTTH